MSLEATRSTVEGYLADNWTATPIQFGNVPFSPDGKDSWIRVVILPVSRVPHTLGIGGYDKELGIVDVAIFVNRNTGVKALFEYADQLTDLFSRKSIGNLTFYQIDSAVHGADDDGRFWMTLSFYYRAFE